MKQGWRNGQNLCSRHLFFAGLPPAPPRQKLLLSLAYRADAMDVAPFVGLDAKHNSQGKLRHGGREKGSRKKKDCPAALIQNGRHHLVGLINGNAAGHKFGKKI